MSEAQPVIQTRDLRRDYKAVHAVDGLTLVIQRGELFGLVGPDGAGKTTTLRLLAGLLDISAGEASVLGFDLGEQAELVKRRIGYMAQQFSLYGELSVLENLHFFAELFDVPAQEMAKRTDELLVFAGLTEFTQRRAARLSGGMQKKLALACTLIHQPELLLLDEPTTGVDPIARREFWNILTDLHAQRTTIVVSTPYMDEADRCSRVGLMYGGRLVECDSPRRIRQKLDGEVIEVRCEDVPAALTALTDAPGVREMQTYGKSLHVLVDSAARRLPELEGLLRSGKLAHQGLRSAPARMEEAFISIIRKLDA
ncbi:MAG TPA: ABC transporter ATP-binding protein [Anaerolineales bacterium]|nr:ABC transporter ATP-binding protein [Anaerolineales bacterium]